MESFDAFIGLHLLISIISLHKCHLFINMVLNSDQTMTFSDQRETHHYMNFDQYYGAKTWIKLKSNSIQI